MLDLRDINKHIGWAVNLVGQPCKGTQIIFCNNVISQVYFTYSGEQVKLPMYTQELTTDKYIYKSGLPAISAFTMCYWYKGLNSARLSDHPISISSSGLRLEFKKKLSHCVTALLNSANC